MNCWREWQGVLTICRKAGKLVIGAEPTKEALRKGLAQGVLIASDVSEKSRKEAVFFSEKARTAVISLPLTKAEIGRLIGNAAGVLAVCDGGFFRRMQTIEDDTAADAPENIS